MVRPGTSLAAVLTMLSGSCTTSIPPLDAWAQQSVGRPIGELRELDRSSGSYASRIGWKEKTYPLDDGRWVYVHPDRPGCEIHFEVGSDGNVVGYRAVGDGCR